MHNRNAVDFRSDGTSFTRLGIADWQLTSDIGLYRVFVVKNDRRITALVTVLVRRIVLVFGGQCVANLCEVVCNLGLYLSGSTKRSYLS